ncbi:G-type lectin S-receptor-like serine/threonine-protein kinase LECRK1 isoform X2 [Rhodamnia argentea]|uniref:Receptor-like serine/threonine-protein kinase n=1 Tax=Rhodamnia argentea TaxID=178133 RepID=A0A8B8N3V0_9MYRT|nr:G-type lectin S-receptor-like serine/threonine-protein kinase LECRK1 isoform X2 [Rhodamnia argentea]
MASKYALFLLLLVHYRSATCDREHPGFIRLGSFLSPANHSTSWLSPSGRFAFGFYPNGDGFSVGIWMTSEAENTTPWTANRDDRPVRSTAMLELTLDGRLLLRTDSRNSKLIASVSESASYAAMNDSGNFILYDKDHHVIWDSFSFPTDTLMGGQYLPHGAALLSSMSKSNRSTGRFRLEMQDDGNLVLYPIHTPNISLDAYWASVTQGDRLDLHLNSTGALLLIKNTDSTVRGTLYGGSSVSNNSITYRLVLDSNGILQLYSHSFNRTVVYKTSLEWSIPDDKCSVKSFCGFNSYCTLDDDQPVCRCLPGTNFVDMDQKSRGCERNFTEEWCRDSGRNASSRNIVPMENMGWDDPPYFQAKMQEDDCSKSCLEDCDCDVALLDLDSYCKKQKLPLKYARRNPKASSTAFFKVGFEGVKEKQAGATVPEVPLPTVIIRTKDATVLLLVVTLGLVTWSCVALAISGLFAFKLRFFEYRKLLDRGDIGLSQELALRSFSYKELKRATNGFKEELGKGSFGAVYKGSFSKGKRIVAVKRLEKVINEGEREFRAEMRVIGRTHHKNLVRLLGYCAEESKRLLVYEFMSNGSLADLLFRSQRRPDWSERVRIATEIAKGILYLHEECDAPIIHCDIKPQNILMDDFWTAKISDFGLAKLLMPDQTRTFTGVRGTRGYMAPEWQKNTPISLKTDVYSYGIVLLEIVCCRRNMEVDVQRPEEIVLSSWVYMHFEAGELEKLVRGEEVERKSLEKLIKVGLWCIQDEPALRPSMKCVAMMLEGITDIAVPPCPTAASL